MRLYAICPDCLPRLKGHPRAHVHAAVGDPLAEVRQPAELDLGLVRIAWAVPPEMLVGTALVLAENRICTVDEVRSWEGLTRRAFRERLAMPSQDLKQPAKKGSMRE